MQIAQHHLPQIDGLKIHYSTAAAIFGVAANRGSFLTQRR
jgi:hypothetical protein